MTPFKEGSTPSDRESKFSGGAQGDDGEMANRWRGLDKGDQALAVRDGD
jgi:hypothetical protein